MFSPSEWDHESSERRKETKGKIPDEHVFFLYFVLVFLLKLLRRFGKYWQYSSKLKDTFVIFFFGLLRIVALVMPVSVAFVAVAAVIFVESLQQYCYKSCYSLLIHKFFLHDIPMKQCREFVESKSISS